MANMLIMFYLFCSGKTEDNLAHIFSLFDQDGNKVQRVQGQVIYFLQSRYSFSFKGNAFKKYY